MQHDPLCVCSRKDHAHFYTIPSDVCMCCKCDDISRVRADEREKAAQRIETLPARYVAPGMTLFGLFDAAVSAARGGSDGSQESQILTTAL